MPTFITNPDGSFSPVIVGDQLQLLPSERAQLQRQDAAAALASQKGASPTLPPKKGATPPTTGKGTLDTPFTVDKILAQINAHYFAKASFYVITIIDGSPQSKATQTDRKSVV